MKYLTVFTPLLMSIIFTNGPALARGPSNGGGGAGPEAGFKAAMVMVAQEMHAYPDSIKAELNFNTGLLMTAAYSGAPQCAKSLDDIKLLKSKRKFAYVKRGNEILLNCEDDAQDHVTVQWLELMSSLRNKTDFSVQSKVLLAHEAFRSAGVEEENSYLKSGTISVALFKIKEIELQQIGNMWLKDWFNNYKEISVGDCNIQVQDIVYSDNLTVIIRKMLTKYPEVTLKSFSELYTSKYGVDGKASPTRLALLNPNTSIHQDVVKVLRISGCFKY